MSLLLIQEINKQHPFRVFTRTLDPPNQTQRPTSSAGIVFHEEMRNEFIFFFFFILILISEGQNTRIEAMIHGKLSE